MVFDDFAGTLHAACLLFVPLLTGGFVFAFSASPNRERVLWAVGIAAAMGGVYAGLGGYFRAGGWPVMQLALPLACAWGGLFIGLRAAHRAFSIGLLSATIGLLAWFGFMTQGRYVGDPSWVGGQHADLEQRKALLQARMVKSARDVADEFKPGWFADSEIVTRLQMTGERFDGVMDCAQPLWHTWVTSLWARGPSTVSLWFPGGTIVEGAARLEWRVR